MSLAPQRLQALLERHDVFHTPKPLSGDGRHKEWSHFCVHQAGLHLILNFSLSSLGSSTQVAALALCGEPSGPGGRTRRQWTGHLQRHAFVDATLESLSISMPGAQLTLADGKYGLAIQADEFSCELEIEPRAMPYLANNLEVVSPRREGSLGQQRRSVGTRRTAAPQFNWFVLPRAAASGWIQTRRGRNHLEAAACYHDRNWGKFDWGDDFSWEWGFTLESGQYSFVFSRVSDSSRHRALSQGILVWKSGQLIRAFRGEELSVQRIGVLSGTSSHSLPAVLRFLTRGSSGASQDLPQRLLIRASADGDVLELQCELEELVQILVPAARAARAVTINEVLGRIRAQGRLAGEQVEAESYGNFEFLCN